MKKILMMCICLLTLTVSANATTYLVYGTTLRVYAQGTSGSEAHFVRSSKGIYNNGEHPWCGNRAYIEFADSDLFKRALISDMMDSPVNIIYEDAGENRFIKGHADSTCKIISIWR